MLTLAKVLEAIWPTLNFDARSSWENARENGEAERIADSYEKRREIVDENDGVYVIDGLVYVCGWRGTYPVMLYAEITDEVADAIAELDKKNHNETGTT